MPAAESGLLAPCDVVVEGPSRFLQQVKAVGQPHGMRTSFVVNDQTNLVILSPESVTALRENNITRLSTKIQQAIKRNIPLVPLSFLHDCIDAQTLLYAPDYACTSVHSSPSKSSITNATLTGPSFPQENRPALPSVNLLEGWREAKIFLSSTFRDMHGERDYLTRFVFPELQERCEALQVHVTVIDLRWGVTQEQAENGTAVELCLNHVEECRPFFVGLIGSRYGWIPEELPPALYERFPWLEEEDGLSVTHMEMKLAALLPSSSGQIPFKPLIYIRDEAFQRDVPADYQEDFEAESAHAFDQLYRLKEELRDGGHIQMESYPCQWMGVRDGKPMTGHLKELGQHLLERLWAQMQEFFPAEVANSQATPWERQRQEHALVIEQHARSFVGRQALLENLSDSVLSGSNCKIVAGQPGCGKTSLMAAFARHASRWARQNSKHVISHFIGNARDSTSLRLMLLRLCTELRELWGMEPLAENVHQDYNLLASEFRCLVTGERRITVPVIIIIDAVNQLDDTHTPWLFDWLPGSPDYKVTIVLSTLGGKYYDQLRAMNREHLPRFSVMMVGELDPGESRAIVQSRLQKYGKSLSQRQMELLLDKEEASLPLFLTLACEELRVFGVFEKLDERIQSMAGTLSELFEEVLARLEDDLGSTRVRALFALLASSRQGLTVQECAHLLGIWDQPRLPGWHAVQPLPTEDWQRLERGVKTYLSYSGSGESVRVTFFHERLLFAVRLLYLGAEDDLSSPHGHSAPLAHQAHAKLAQYFSLLADPNQDRRWKGEARGFSELPYHSVCAQAWSNVKATLGSLPFLEMKIQQGMVYELLDDFTFLFSFAGASSLETRVSEQLHEYYQFLKGRAHLLLRRPALTFSVALSLPDHSSPYQEAQARWRSGQERRPYLRWVNKPQQEDPCDMTLQGHTKSVTGCDVAHTKGKILLASASHDSTVRLWDGFAGSPIAVLSGVSGTLHCCVLSRDGSRVMTGTWRGQVVVWDVASRQLLKQFDLDNAVESACFTANNDHIIVGTLDGYLHSVRLDKQDTSEFVHSVSCMAAAGMTLQMARTGHVLAVVLNQEGTISLCSPDTLNPLVGGMEEMHQKCHGVAWSPRDEYLAVGVDRSVVVWSVKQWTLSRLRTLQGHVDGVVALSFHDSKPWLLSASHDNLILLWNYHTGEQLERFLGHTGSVLGCAFYPGVDEKRFVTCSFDRSVKVWAVAEQAGVRSSTQQQGHSGRLLCVACSPTGGEILTGSRDKTFKAWGPYELDRTGALTSERAVVRWTSTSHRTNVVGCAYSPNGKRIVTVDRNGTVVLTEASSGREIKSFTVDEAAGVAFSPSGDTIAVASNCGTFIYSTSGEEITTVACSSCVAYSPDGLKMVTGTADDGVIKLWCARQRERSLALYRGHEQAVRCCAFSPDSKRILTGGADSKAMEWSAANAQHLSTLSGHDSPVMGCAYSPDGRYIFTGSTDGMAIVWDVKTREEVAAFACLGRITCLAPYPSSRVTAFVVGDGSGIHYLLQLVQ